MSLSNEVLLPESKLGIEILLDLLVDEIFLDELLRLDEVYLELVEVFHPLEFLEPNLEATQKRTQLA